MNSLSLKGPTQLDIILLELLEYLFKNKLLYLFIYYFNISCYFISFEIKNFNKNSMHSILLRELLNVFIFR